MKIGRIIRFGLRRKFTEKINLFDQDFFDNLGKKTLERSSPKVELFD